MTYPSALACMINAEAAAVLAVMRRYVRWGSRPSPDDDHLDHPLVASLKSLRHLVFYHALVPSVYLHPFLDLIRSDETGAPITRAALSSVLKILLHGSVNIETAIRAVVIAVTGCHFEVTDPASEEAVLLKILQVLLDCLQSRAATPLSNRNICTIVFTCFRIVHQAGSKGELLQSVSRYTMHELVRCVFSRLPDLAVRVDHCLTQEIDGIAKDGSKVAGADAEANLAEENDIGMDVPEDSKAMKEPYGVPCMMEIFHFLCSLLDIGEQIREGWKLNPIAFVKDVPLFALGLVNSVIEVGGAFIRCLPQLLALVQVGLFYNLMQFGLSKSPLVLSTVCNIVLNFYFLLWCEIKPQIEAFHLCMLPRFA